MAGVKLSHTASEYGLKQGSLIWIETLLANNAWPTDKSNRKLEPLIAMESAGETVGLYNLGNTCYINSAMQCIANIKLMHDYFVRDKLYLRQLNLNSVLGYKGDLVVAFSNMMQQMWTANQVLVPKAFKASIGKMREAFAGDEQQDSQEYLNFIIDGLHEEVNLRQSKPYIANPESDGREDMELGLETWSNSLKRDWSFIFFLFYG